MQLVLFMIIGSMVMGIAFKKLDRRANLALVLMVLLAALGFIMTKRFL